MLESDGTSYVISLHCGFYIITQEQALDTAVLIPVTGQGEVWLRHSSSLDPQNHTDTKVFTTRGCIHAAARIAR